MAKNDHRAFAEKILREKDEALKAMLSAGEVPLRYGESRIVRATLTPEFAVPPMLPSISSGAARAGVGFPPMMAVRLASMVQRLQCPLRRARGWHEKPSPRSCLEGVGLDCDTSGRAAMRKQRLSNLSFPPRSCRAGSHRLQDRCQARLFTNVLTGIC